MNKDTIAIEANAPAIAPKEGTEVIVPTTDDLEAKITALEEEKQRFAKEIEENANYKLAYLKAKGKSTDDLDLEETEEERIARIIDQRIANSRIAEINKEKDEIIKKALKENKELKLAYTNKSVGVPTGAGSHNESIPVRDTLVTPSQLEAFKARGWTDKDIERYKKNLAKSVR